jgi:hypothetical protein
MSEPVSQSQLPLPDLSSNWQTNVAPLKPIIDELNKITRYLKQLHAHNAQMALSIQPQVMRLAHALGVE